MTPRASPGYLLAVDTGSSSVKCAAFDDSAALAGIVSAVAEGIGGSENRVSVWSADGSLLHRLEGAATDHAVAVTKILDWMDGQRPPGQLRGVGHRIVHGGPGRFYPSSVTPELLRDLWAWGSVDPDHLPQSVRAIELVGERYPTIPQVVCYDTAFHRTMPPVARRYPLPRKYREAGVERYGFHGLSYEYIVGELRKLDPGNVGGRTVVAHLGSGASMAAILRGTGVDTSMGFTPTGGLIMSSRSGDLDPGILPFLMERFGEDRAGLVRLLNREAGLWALSGGTSDMKTLLARQGSDTGAADAVESFCYQARKYLGAYVAVLGGLDTLVFTGGIGENSEEIRARVCAGWEFLGLRLDPVANRAGASLISSGASSVNVRVMKTDENRVVAQHLRTFLEKAP
ncbi:MAG: acetate/propionate family kinase [Thermoplasmata archaeon]|nr:acetate/propionate family kinase [Thermoplasmata archaeon]